MLVLSWNVRGLGKGEKKKIVCSLVNKVKSGMLFIQETKIKSFDSRVIRAIGGTTLNRGVGVDADVALGGLITLWSEDFFTAESCISNKNCLIISGTLNKFKKDIVFCNVYAASVESERRELWDFILASQQSLTAPWCVGGDFNTVLDPSERVGVSENLGSYRNFASFIAQANIIDIPLHGMSYTWSNNRKTEAWARLDRFLLSAVYFVVVSKSVSTWAAPQSFGSQSGGD
ncbi:hypothetical protein Dsin_014485 [Dipteronia sinensis]|uniref:Endonuclease/exonuclease/phosphatase domain-containing protein n=1 Tax=Dipteronia sinensis TaxID=43782 RepID=A0AAE0AMZ8_9ROSI|nr:hypothetical protein Dsin_014485 [Dipteronia sinensis]